MLAYPWVLVWCSYHFHPYQPRAPSLQTTRLYLIATTYKPLHRPWVMVEEERILTPELPSKTTELSEAWKSNTLQGTIRSPITRPHTSICILHISKYERLSLLFSVLITTYFLLPKSMTADFSIITHPKPNSSSLPQSLLFLQHHSLTKSHHQCSSQQPENHPWYLPSFLLLTSLHWIHLQTSHVPPKSHGSIHFSPPALLVHLDGPSSIT